MNKRKGVKIIVEGPYCRGKTHLILKAILPYIKSIGKTSIFADAKSTKKGIEAALEKYDFIIVEKTIKGEKE